MMRRYLSLIFGILAAVALAANASAEKTVPVNASPGAFDQPSVAVEGNVNHVAYIGADNTGGPFRLFYAAGRGGAELRNMPLTRLTLEKKAVVKQSVRRVTGISGFVEDVSFGLVTADNTARVAYAGRQGVLDPFGVSYARISLDSAAVTGSPGTPLLLSSVPGSTGSRPLPNLKLDGLNRAHVSWAANSVSSTPNGVYYALVKEQSGADSVVIAATGGLGRSRKWGHPHGLVSSTSSLILLAAAESLPGTSGNLGLVNINPDADNKDGRAVQVPTNTNFLLTPPGGAILPERFALFRPEASLDALWRIH